MLFWKGAFSFGLKSLFFWVDNTFSIQLPIGTDVKETGWWVLMDITKWLLQAHCNVLFEVFQQHLLLLFTYSKVIPHACGDQMRHLSKLIHLNKEPTISTWKHFCSKMTIWLTKYTRFKNSSVMSIVLSILEPRHAEGTNSCILQFSEVHSLGDTFGGPPSHISFPENWVGL